MAKDSEPRWAELLKAGVGAFLITKDKVMEELDKILEEKGVGEQEKKDIKSKLMERATEERGKMEKTVREALEGQIEKAGFVRREELEKLEKRLADLEDNIQDEER